MFVAKIKKSRFCELELANLLDSQVKNSKKIYLTILSKFLSKIDISQSNVTILSDYLFHIYFNESY